MSVTCYDNGFYLKTARRAANRGKRRRPSRGSFGSTYGVPTGALAQTGVSISRKFSAAAVYQIIDTAYTLASRQTGKSTCCALTRISWRWSSAR